jgi:hypothetical protein
LLGIAVHKNGLHPTRTLVPAGAPVGVATNAVSDRALEVGCHRVLALQKPGFEAVGHGLDQWLDGVLRQAPSRQTHPATDLRTP